MVDPFEAALKNTSYNIKLKDIKREIVTIMKQYKSLPKPIPIRIIEVFKKYIDKWHNKKQMILKGDDI
jgi:hypothetical protein